MSESVPRSAEACLEVARKMQREYFLAGNMHAANTAKAIGDQIESLPVRKKSPDASATREFVRFENWVNGTSEILDGMKSETSERMRVGIGLLHLSLEHQIGILALSDHGLIGCAKAIIRPQVDAVIRGIWYLNKATDQQVRAFLDGGQPPKYRVLIDQIGALEEFNHDVWAKLKTDTFPFLHDFTHGGQQQVIARVTSEEIVADYRPEDAIWVMRSSSSLGLMAGVVMAGFCKEEDRARALLDFYQKIFDSPA